MPLLKCLGAEFFGTFWLVLGGCGTAVLAGAEVKFAGVALAFGLAVLTMAYAVGPVSGGHFNPAVTLGLAAGGRFPWSRTIPYILVQAVAAAAASGVLFSVLSGKPGAVMGGFATNGYDELSPGGYDLVSCAITEFMLTFVFLFVIMGSTHKNAQAALAPVAIGLCLTLIHLISIPVTNTSVNPARSFGPALVTYLNGKPEAMGQLWFFLAAPVAGAVVGAMVFRLLVQPPEKCGCGCDGK